MPDLQQDEFAQFKVPPAGGQDEFAQFKVKTAPLSPALQKNRALNASPTQFELERPPQKGNPDFQPGFGGRVADLARGVTDKFIHGSHIPEAMSPGQAIASTKQQIAASSAEDDERKKQGHGLLYRGAAKIAPAVGVDVKQVEQDADKGDKGAILGGTAPQAALATAPLAAEGLNRIPFEKTPVAVNKIGRSIERNAPTIGKVAGYGVTGAGVAERLIHGHPVEASILATQTPRIARVAETGARGAGRLIARMGHPEAPFAPDTGPMVHEGEYIPPEANPPQLSGKVQPPIAQVEPGNQKLLAEKSVIPTDTITADAGEVARRHMIGAKPTEPVILPRENRGLMLPDRGATVAPEAPAAIPPRQRIDTIAKEAVKGAGGSPAEPAPLERGKPIYQRPERKLGESRIPTEPPMTKTEGSSALNGYHYDPATQTMTVDLKSGAKYRYAEVTPEEFSKFEGAESKGKAYQDIKNNHVRTEFNYGNGWSRKIPAKALHSSETVPDVAQKGAIESPPMAAKPKFYSKQEMIAAGADGHLSRAIRAEIPLDQIDGREPTPAMEGGYKKGTPVTQPIEVVYDKAQDKYILYAGNHRVTQAELNGQRTIPAFVENPPKGLKSAPESGKASADVDLAPTLEKSIRIARAAKAKK